MPVLQDEGNFAEATNHAASDGKGAQGLVKGAHQNNGASLTQEGIFEDGEQFWRWRAVTGAERHRLKRPARRWISQRSSSRPVRAAWISWP